MRRTRCEQCGSDLPTRQTFRMEERTLCRGCMEAKVAEMKEKKDMVLEGSVAQQWDPTICSECGTDNGSTEFRKVMGTPMCDACREKVTAKFPMWIKIVFAAVLVLAGVSLIRNMRYFEARWETRRAFAAIEKGNIDEAERLISSASKHAPESRELAALAKLYGAILLVRDGNVKEALPMLRDAHREFPSDVTISRFTTEVEGMAAFRDKNYDKFLAIQLGILKDAPDEAAALAGVASAYACKYAATGEEKYKAEAMKHLEMAEKRKAQYEGFEDYRARIMHRLETREIITPEEYHKRFGQDKME